MTSATPEGDNLTTAVHADLNAAYAAEWDAITGELLGDLDNWKPTGFIQAARTETT